MERGRGHEYEAAGFGYEAAGLKYEAARLKYEAAGVGAGGGHDTSRHVPVRPFRPGGLPPPPITYIRQVHARIVAHGEKPTPALA